MAFHQQEGAPIELAVVQADPMRSRRDKKAYVTRGKRYGERFHSTIALLLSALSVKEALQTGSLCPRTLSLVHPHGKHLTSRMLGAPFAEKKSAAWLGPLPMGSTASFAPSSLMPSF